MNMVRPFPSRAAVALAWAMTTISAWTNSSAAVDTGVGRAAVSVANIDPTSAVVGSTQIRSLPGQEADSASVQLLRFAAGQPASAGSPVSAPNGRYVISVSPALAAGENVYVRNVATGATSATAVVQLEVAPVLSGPLSPNDASVSGYATPGRTVTIHDALSGTALGGATASLGTGAFSVAVPPLKMFQALRAMDDDELQSSSVTVLGFSAATTAGLPPATCPAVVLQASAPTVTRFECGLLNPRGIAALPDGSLRVVAGLPPTGLINIPPAATVRFVPGTQEAALVSPITGVGVVYDSTSSSLFIARPHLFRLQEERTLERQDGEILRMDPSSGEATVATRLLDLAPTGLALDTSAGSVFGGGLILSSLFFEPTTLSSSYAAGAAAGDGSALWTATLTTLAPMAVQASSPLSRLHGVVVGNDFDGAPALFAAQPGSGSIFRILGSGGSFTAAPLLTGLGSPVELAIPPTGSPFGTALYATDADGGRILKITVASGGGSTVQSYVTGLDRPYGLTFGATGLFVTEFSGSIVAIYP